ncbi:MAG: hypothetical protein ACP5HU_09000 [Phycisphaerae bacterium]
MPVLLRRIGRQYVAPLGGQLAAAQRCGHRIPRGRPHDQHFVGRRRAIPAFHRFPQATGNLRHSPSGGGRQRHRLALAAVDATGTHTDQRQVLLKGLSRRFGRLLLRQGPGRRRIDLYVLTTGTELAQRCILHDWSASFP